LSGIPGTAGRIGAEGGRLYEIYVRARPSWAGPIAIDRLGVRAVLPVTRSGEAYCAVASESAVIGAPVGIALPPAATRLLTSRLFELKPADPPTLAISVAPVVVVALGARHPPRVAPAAFVR